MKKWNIKVTYLIDGIEKEKNFPQDTAKVNFEKLINEIHIAENISAFYEDFSIDEFTVERV